MKKITLSIIVLVVLLFSLSIVEASGLKMRESHADNECITCHIGQEHPAQPGEISCKGCHMSPDKVAEKTANLGKQNPHTSPHWGTTTPCWVCHKEHDQDVNYCLTCHIWDEKK